jgi:cbb3-type cytochrome oxidase subunit 3
MTLDYGTLHSIATVLAIIGFAAICWWAYRPANSKRFEQDGLLPIITDPILTHQIPHTADDKNSVGAVPTEEHDK